MKIIIYVEALAFKDWVSPLLHRSCKPVVQIQYHSGHLEASCSNIGRIRTKENIVVDTLLIGNAKATGGYMIVFESYLNPFGTVF